MSEHLTKTEIEDYGRQKLSAAELLSVSDHLSACEACRRQVESALDGDAAFFALKSGVFDDAAERLSSPVGRTHLTFEQTAEYVDGALAGEELQEVKDHLNSCEQCVVAVHDLRAFRDQVAPDLDREYRPSPPRLTTGKRWRRFVTALPSLLPKSPALAFGSVLAALLLIVAGWLIWQALQSEAVKTKITKTTPSPTITSGATPVVIPSVLPTPTPEVEAPAVARLNDGEGQLILDRNNKLSGVDHLPPVYQQLVKEALTNQQLERSPLLAGLTRPGSSLMSGGDTQGARFSVIEPVGKVMISDYPTFRWSRLDGATGYVVEVYDEKFNLVATSPQLTDNSWTAPQSLKPGEIYSWQVKAGKDGQEFISPRPPAPQAKFRILDQAKANELVQARRTFASSHLTLGLLYVQAGLLDEAEREFRALQKANPNSAIVRQLLANVQALRR